MLAYLIIGIVLLCFIVYLLSNKKPLREGFGDVLGAAGPYKDIYFKCLSDCEREDPRLRLGNNNLYCGMACDTHISEIAKEEPLPIPEPITEQDVCDKKCNGNDQCVADCTCYREVKKFCEMECRFSPMKKKDCVDSCSLAYIPNCSSGSWTWK